MARTPRSAGTQNTLGPVGRAVLPTDPVPLEQSSGGNTFVQSSEGYYQTITQSKQYQWFLNSHAKDGDLLNVPSAAPFLMRLKEVKWNLSGTGSDLNIYRAGQIVATVPKNTAASLDILFQPGQNGSMVTSGFLRLAFWWTLIVKWEIVSYAAPGAVEDQDIQSAISEVLAPIPQIEQPLAAAEPIAAKGSNRFASWIKRRFR